MSAIIGVVAVTMVGCGSPIRPSDSHGATRGTSSAMTAPANPGAAVVSGCLSVADPVQPSSGGGTFTLTLTASCLWSVTSDQPWLTTSSRPRAWSGSDSITYSVAENTSPASRTGRLIVTANSGDTVTMVITQPGVDSTLTGLWVGLAPDGILFPSGAACPANITLDLNASGANLTGTVTTQIRGGGCTGENLSSLEQATGQIVPSRVLGSAGSGTLSFFILFVRTFNAVPTSFSSLVASGTFSGGRLTMTGTYTPLRTWNDINRNGIPDCDLTNPNAQGECGPTISNSLPPVTVTATKQ